MHPEKDKFVFYSKEEDYRVNQIYRTFSTPEWQKHGKIERNFEGKLFSG